MNQENINPSTINLRSKGIITSIGKIHKGCVKDATTKLSVGSIPSPYQSIIYKTDNKRAFGTSEKRFYHKQNASTLHTSNYQDISTIQSRKSQTKFDHNRQGQNAFISKQKRQWFRCIKTPGPTYYYKKQESQNPTNSRKCFTRQMRKKITKTTLTKKNQQEEPLISPGPGQYIYQKKQYWNSTNKGWKSSFDTKVTREAYIPDSISPGPGYYNYAVEMNQKNCKTSNQAANQKQNIKNKQNILAQIFKQKNMKQPGPCSYNQQIPTFKPLYERIKMSGNFMVPIFNGKKKNKSGPGPTAYCVKRIYQDLTPKLIQSNFFMSQTKRQPFKNISSFGPNLCPPTLLGHKNFHFNIKNQWVG